MTLRVLALLCLLTPTAASAQVDVVIPDPPADETPASSTTEEDAAEAWPVAPPEVLRDGVRDPRATSGPDDGILWNGLGLLIGAYVTGVALTLPWALTGCPREEGFAAFSFVPFAQWAAGFSTSEAAIPGGVFSGLQFAGLIFVIVALAIDPASLRSERRPGDFSLRNGGLEIGF